tara:strand:+ start:570 stop:1106 length:537 start_codon:yes stop_codon:yes gene_type:complete
MSKYNSILVKIKLFYLIITGKIKKNHKVIKIFRESGIDIKNILIIFPVEEEDFRVALYVFRNLTKEENINYYFLINKVFKQHFHLNGYVFNITSNKNKIKIDETFYEDRILNKEYDMVIDLNKEFLFDIALITNRLYAKFKVGIKNEFSDYFYNIQFNLNDKGILEKTYDKICLMLKK